DVARTGCVRGSGASVGIPPSSEGTGCGGNVTVAASGGAAGSNVTCAEATAPEVAASSIGRGIGVTWLHCGHLATLTANCTSARSFRPQDENAKVIMSDP